MSYLCVLGQLKVGPADVGEDPASVVVLGGERGQDVDGFSAVVGAQHLVTTTQLP